MNSSILITFIVIILFALEVTCPLPDKAKDFCTDLSDLKTLVQKHWFRYQIKEFRLRKLLKRSKPHKRSSINDDKIFNKTTNDKITSGFPVTPGTFPYFVGIHFKNDKNDYASCGGVLVESHWILSSENCIMKHMFQKFAETGVYVTPLAVANVHRKSRILSQPISQFKIICKLTDSNNPWSDVTLIRVEPEIKMWPIVLGKNPPNIGDYVTNVGFGYIEADWNGDYVSDDLRQRSVVVSTNRPCEQLLTKRATKFNTFCATGTGSWTDGDKKQRGHSCTFDGGGPVVGNYGPDFRNHVLVGIQSNIDYERPCMNIHHWRLYSRIDGVIFNIKNILKAFNETNWRDW